MLTKCILWICNLAANCTAQLGSNLWILCSFCNCYELQLLVCVHELITCTPLLIAWLIMVYHYICTIKSIKLTICGNPSSPHQSSNTRWKSHSLALFVGLILCIGQVCYLNPLKSTPQQSYKYCCHGDRALCTRLYLCVSTKVMEHYIVHTYACVVIGIQLVHNIYIWQLTRQYLIKVYISNYTQRSELMNCKIHIVLCLLLHNQHMHA